MHHLPVKKKYFSLTHLRLDIGFTQETHFKYKDTNRLKVR